MHLQIRELRSFQSKWKYLKYIFLLDLDKYAQTNFCNCHVIAHEDEEVRMILSPRWTNII